MASRPVGVHGAWPPRALYLLLWGLVGLLLTAIVSAGGRLPFEFLLDTRFQQQLGRSVFQAALSATLSVALGLGLAFLHHHAARRWIPRGLSALLSTVPVMPTLVVVLMVLAAYGRKGLMPLSGGLYGLTGILIAHVFLNAPWVAAQLELQWQRVPDNQQRLVQQLGLSRRRSFGLLLWPRSRGLLVTQWWLVFLLCFTSFAIVLVLGGGPRWATLEVALFQAIKLDFDLGRAALIALVQLLVLAPLAWVGSRAPWLALNDRTGAVGPVRTVGFAIAYWLVLGFWLLPMAALLWRGLGDQWLAVWSQRAVQQAALTSLWVGSLSATLVVAMAWVLGQLRRSRSGLDRWLSVSAWLAFMVPTQVLALGLFLLARGGGWVSPGAAVVLSNVLLCLPFVGAVLWPAMDRHHTRSDRLALQWALHGVTRVWRIDLAVLKPVLVWGWVFAFGLSLGDFGVIALFGTENFQTLPYLLYQKLGSYRTQDAFALALWLWLPVWLLFIWAHRTRSAHATR
ncbi:ABC transporter permease subunit [Litorivicinus lipolyticus]|uniref:ABC transporter permease subunit n=1 Tax=Litorivicinus lipolyticus TaxID=418701 RepID=A0A5Q2QC61_9GAMM|nr:ABC transporter permease subunit [Litorivicinus lipolyticus]